MISCTSASLAASFVLLPGLRLLLNSALRLPGLVIHHHRPPHSPPSVQCVLVPHPSTFLKQRKHAGAFTHLASGERHMVLASYSLARRGALCNGARPMIKCWSLCVGWQAVNVQAQPRRGMRGRQSKKFHPTGENRTFTSR